MGYDAKAIKFPKELKRMINKGDSKDIAFKKLMKQSIESNIKQSSFKKSNRGK